MFDDLFVYPGIKGRAPKRGVGAGGIIGSCG